MIVVNHCKKLKDRKTHILDELRQFSDDFIVNDCLDADDIRDTIDLYYRQNKKIAVTKSLATSFNTPAWVLEPLKVTQVSLIEKNIRALTAFSRSKDEFCAILEDDVTFKTKTPFGEIAKNAPANWDLIFFGGFSYDIEHAPIVKKTGKYSLVGNPATNGACAVIYGQTAALRIISSLTAGYDLPYDWELNYIIKKYNLTVYHYDYTCKQLSKTTMETSLV